MSLGKAILRIRQDKGLTQIEVGRRAGLATSYVSRIENNHVQPTMTTLRRLAKALEVEVASMFDVGEGTAEARAHRCPVSSSGDCIGELIRSHQGRAPKGGKARYGKEELRLLRMTEYIVAHGSPKVRGALGLLLESLVAHAGGKSPRADRVG